MEISSAVLVDILERIRPILHKVATHAPDDLPSFFDVLCAAGIALFHDARVNLAIIECGLGGRYDATNVIVPELCCITSIELEHVDKLGINIADIAAHKAGIIKPLTPVVCGPMPAPALAVVEQEAQRVRAPLYRFGEDFSIESLSVSAPEQTDLQHLRYTAAAIPEVEF